MIGLAIFMRGQVICPQLLASRFPSVPNAPAGRTISVGTRYVCSQFSQTNDQSLEFVRREGGEQSFLSRKSHDNHAVMQRVPRFRQTNDARAIVLGIAFASNEPSLIQLVKGSAHRALVESNSVDDLVCADVGHAGKHAHHAPLRYADPKMLSVRVRCASREPIGNIREKIRNMTIEVEHGSVGRPRISFTSGSLRHQRVSAARGGKSPSVSKYAERRFRSGTISLEQK